MTLPPGLCRPKWLMKGKWKELPQLARGSTKGANYNNWPPPASVVSICNDRETEAIYKGKSGSN